MCFVWAAMPAVTWKMGVVRGGHRQKQIPLIVSLASKRLYRNAATTQNKACRPQTEYPEQLSTAQRASANGLRSVAFVLPLDCKSCFRRGLVLQRNLSSLRGGSPDPPREKRCSRPRQRVLGGGSGDPPREVAL